ncbi:hypothetical protein LR48_Vigan05g183000 [Vigna angularis]|uniref:Uncharacterized protein n=1 Tax=Phaseolus angularis TaxID=3914 RepID=A0A0L9UMU1_PHAAN|nr:hypothetical protein LR48_Vigan05g183000 [Vigna angularis]
MAGAASALFLLDIKGRVLTWPDYRRKTLLHQAHRETGSFRFTSLLSSTHSRNANPHSLATLLSIEGRSAVSRSGRGRQRRNLHQVFKHYFEELEEESLRDNFVSLAV